MRSMRVAVALAAAASLAAAGEPADGRREPDRVVVQHVLIGFKHSIPNKTLERSKAQARQLAEDLLRRARDGEDFDALVRQYTDDRHPGIYVLTNHKAPRTTGARTRDEMVPRFGDVAFRLEVGEVELAEYHAALCPYGWHVLKRLE
jgi:foldase protein PrsA